MALALLMAPLRMLPCTRQLAAIAAASFLIAFDRYARGGDMLAARKSELRKPIRKQLGAAACWSLTMFPVSHDLTSKTNLQDLTVAIASTHSERAWLSEVAEALHRTATSSPMLVPMTPHMYLQLFKLARELAKLKGYSHPHQLRHGGASMDAMQTGPDRMTDIDLGATSPGHRLARALDQWSATQSIRRYRQEAPYLRRLHSLSSSDLTLASSAPAVIVRELKGQL